MMRQDFFLCKAHGRILAQDLQTGSIAGNLPVLLVMTRKVIVDLEGLVDYN